MIDHNQFRTYGDDHSQKTAIRRRQQQEFVRNSATLVSMTGGGKRGDRFVRRLPLHKPIGRQAIAVLC